MAKDWTYSLIMILDSSSTHKWNKQKNNEGDQKQTKNNNEGDQCTYCNHTLCMTIHYSGVVWLPDLSEELLGET